MAEGKTYQERVTTMKANNYKVRMIIAIGSIALASMTGVSMAQDPTSASPSDSQAAHSGSARQDSAQNATQQLNKAAQVVNRMNSNPKLQSLLAKAQGVFIETSYGRAALGVGGQGGKGVLMFKQGGQWASSPAFYNTGGVSLGLQAGVEGGQVALILNNQRAVDAFRNNNKWSLNADAGLTIVKWSPQAEAEAGRGDVVVWASTKGLFGSAAVSVNDIHYNQKQTNAFYGKPVTVQDIFNGSVTAPQREVATLTNALSGTQGSSSVGSSTTPSAQGAPGSSSGTSGSQGASDNNAASGSSQQK
jgi:lipid-binding SYLF domain-containing protein